MTKEERVLFPMIRRGGRGEAVYMPVRVMESEHDGHRIALDRIRVLTGDEVLVELTPYDLTKGRITYRFQPGRAGPPGYTG